VCRAARNRANSFNNKKDKQMDTVDKIVGIVERAIRGRLQLTPTEFDLFFADAAKEIAWTFDEFVEDEFAHDDE
jgi:hypothetical protein